MNILQQNLPPDNDRSYIEHDPLRNTFSIIEDLNQSEKD